MKKTTIENRLAKSNVSKSCSAYSLMKEWLAADGNKVIRPCWTSGRGRFTQNRDYTDQLCSLLDSMKVRYQRGNDAPRGGKTGNYVKLLNITK